MSTTPVPTPPRPVPWRTIIATITCVLATFASIIVLRELTRIISWLVIAAFFAVVLNPAVDLLQRRLRLRRGLAAMLVFVVGLALLVAMLYAFIRPIVDQASQFADRFPEYVADAKAGRGQVGRIVKNYNIDGFIERNQEQFKESLSQAGKPALEVAQAVLNTITALLTVVVLTILMLLRGPGMLEAGLKVLPERRAERVRRVAADCSRAVTGYVAGNLAISLIAGVSTGLWLLAWGVPFSGVLGLWVAFADLIPLVGATLGAIPAVFVAFLHSTPAGIAALVFYIAYQQFENHILQVTIMSRTVDLNPLVILVSVLAGVELLGFLGALMAIPVAGIIQVIVRDVYDERKGRFKTVPSIGSDETPLTDLEV